MHVAWLDVHVVGSHNIAVSVIELPHGLVVLWAWIHGWPPVALQLRLLQSPVSHVYPKEQ